MPGQKRKYNVRFPPGRIKKIMQTDTEVGRMATAVPVLIAKTLEMFLKSLLTKTSLITQSKNSRVLSINHMKQCIESEKLFDFLKELAEQACGSSAAKESKSKGKCLGHRKKWHMSIKTKSPEKEELPKRCNTEPPKRCNTEPPKRCNTEPPKRCTTEPSDSSSESELVICLETPSP